MRFGVLGTLKVDVDGRAAEITSRHQKALMAVLLVEAGMVVPVDRLVETVWADPPLVARGALHTCVSRLRRQLGGQLGARVRSAGGGYVLDIDPASLDANRFTDAMRAGRTHLAAGWRQSAVEEFDKAIAEWRGWSVVPDVEVAALKAGWGDWIEQERLLAESLRAAIALELGQAKQVVPTLMRLTRRFPFHEEFHAQLMLALYRSGRQSEALETFREIRMLIRMELGVEPGSELAVLNSRILAADPALLP